MRRPQELSKRKSARRHRRLKFLLVESDMLDVRLFQESFRSLKIIHDLRLARNSAQAVRLLSAKVSNRALPDLVLIGLSGLNQDGFGLLSAIRADAQLRTIPVIMLASSSTDADVHRAYGLGANSYLIKPADDFVDLIGDLDRFWFRRAELPPRSSR